MAGGPGFAAQAAPADATGERQALLEQARAMQANLDALNERLARLEKTDDRD
jgi:flagellar hook-associated protein FlgK